MRHTGVGRLDYCVLRVVARGKPDSLQERLFGQQTKSSVAHLQQLQMFPGVGVEEDETERMVVQHIGKVLVLWLD